MGRHQVNYLDIQLRNMDYDGLYPNLYDKFADPKGYYNIPDGYEKPIEQAYNEANKVLDLNMSSTKRGEEDIIKVLIKVLNQRRKKESKFLDAWIRHTNMNVTKVKMPMNGDYSYGSNREYADAFSDFITKAMGASNEIVNLLRSSSFCEKVSGQVSSVYSGRAADRAKAKRALGQSAINKYYEDLFDVFFKGIGGTNSSGNRVISLEDFKKFVPNAQFKKRYLEFIKTYYKELDKDGRITKAFDEGVSQIFDSTVFHKFDNDAPNSFIRNVSEKTGRGVSYKTEQQLKKMLLQSLRNIGYAQGADYTKEFSIPGIIEVNPLWTEQSSGFHMEVQVKINEIRKQRTALKQAQASGRLVNGKRVDMRTENRTYEIARDDDLLNEAGDPIQIKELFLNFFFTKIQEELHRKLTRQEKDELSQAAFQKLDQTIKRGDKALDVMSIFGPYQMKGFLGEWATAYALRTMAGKRTYTNIAGKDVNGVGQSHYDVAATIDGMHIGFQVKNYEPKTRPVYETEIGLGRQEAKKYLGRDLPKYRWLYANGIFVQDIMPNSKHKDLRTDIEKSLYNHIPEFLRISDASVDDPENLIDSDIYVIHDKYYPASFLLACAIKQVKNNMAKSNSPLFTLEGDFPKYQTKAMPTYDFHTNVGKMRYTHKNVGQKKNLVYIDEGSGTRMFGKALIKFKGVQLNFKV